MKNDTKKVPKLRFWGFSDGWKIKKLGEFSKTFSGGTPKSTNKDFYRGKIPFIKSGEISSQKTKQFITKDALKNSSAKLVNKGDILYALYGATSGQVSISEIDGAINQAILCIRPNANKYFIYLKLAGDKDKILKAFLQGGQGNLSADIIKKLNIGLPSEEEQEKIAGLFGIIDDKISSLEKKKELLEKYKKGIIQKIFTQQIRFKVFSGKWEEATLGEVGKTYNGLQGKTAEDFGEGQPYITYRQIFADSTLNTDNFGKVKISTNEKQNTAKKGDVFFTTSSETPDEVGYSSVLLENIEHLYLNSFCFGYKINDQQELFPEFAQFLFRSQDFRKKVVRLAQGSTRYNLSKIELMKTSLEFPRLEEQKKIAGFLTIIDDKIELTKRELEQAKKFKKSLLQQMFV